MQQWLVQVEQYVWHLVFGSSTTSTCFLSFFTFAWGEISVFPPPHNRNIEKKKRETSLTSERPTPTTYISRYLLKYLLALLASVLVLLPSVKVPRKVDDHVMTHVRTGLQKTIPQSKEISTAQVYSCWRSHNDGGTRI